MKRFISAFTALLLLSVCCLGLFACGQEEQEDDVKKFGVADGSLYIYANNALMDCSIVDFDTSRYDVEEYRGFLEEEIGVYNDSAVFVPQTPETDEKGNEIKPPVTYTRPVEISSISAEDNKMNLQLLYATPEDFFGWQEHYDKDAFSKRGGSIIEAGKLVDNETVQGMTFVDRKGEALDMEKLLKRKNVSDVRYVTIDVECVLFGDGNILAYTEGADLDAANNNFHVKGGQKITVLYQ